MELPKTVTDWLKHTGTILVIVAIGLGILLHVRKEHAWQKQVTDLQNQLALKDKTTEVDPGVYSKLVVQNGDLKAALDASDQQVKELEATIKQDGQDLQNVTQIGLHWQQQYAALVVAQQADGGVTKEPDGTTVARQQVNFQQEFPDVDVGVSGSTWTNPAQASLRVWQLQPLKLTVALTQDKTKAWHSYVTSNVKGIVPDIGVTEVNPYILEPKWYEKLAVRGDLGVGSTDAGAGVLLGLGVSYEVGRFDVGPAGWLVISNRVDRYLGVMVGYHPFQRQ